MPFPDLNRCNPGVFVTPPSPYTFSEQILRMPSRPSQAATPAPEAAKVIAPLLGPSVTTVHTAEGRHDLFQPLTHAAPAPISDDPLDPSQQIHQAISGPPKGPLIHPKDYIASGIYEKPKLGAASGGPVPDWLKPREDDTTIGPPMGPYYPLQGQNKDDAKELISIVGGATLTGSGIGTAVFGPGPGTALGAACGAVVGLIIGSVRFW